MAKTFLQVMDELEKLYSEIISLMPYQNDPDVSLKMRELRSKASVIESLTLDL